MKPNTSVMLVGGPGSGKSNYLFRSWIAIEHETGLLRKSGLPLELDYLHEGASSLLSGEFAPHTTIDAPPLPVEIPLAFVGSHTPSQLTVPDVSGEVWDAVYEKREWPVAWDAYVEQGCGFVLFIRAGSPHNVKPLDWLTCERLYKTHGAVRGDPRVPTQVMLVDWVQTLRTLITNETTARHAPRLSVVVTAWDTVDKELGPTDYLNAEFPLFGQFLSAGLHGFDARVFGVSIAGGDLDNATFRAQFLGGNPTKHGYCTVQQGRRTEQSKDVLLPLYWALGHET
jgi:hypothetical protein